MLLAIDAGNTQTHIGMFRGEELVEHWRLATHREETSDELSSRLSGLLALSDLRLRDVDGAIVSCVVPQLGHEYERVSERQPDKAYHQETPYDAPKAQKTTKARNSNPH